MNKNFTVSPLGEFESPVSQIYEFFFWTVGGNSIQKDLQPVFEQGPFQEQKCGKNSLQSNSGDPVQPSSENEQAVKLASLQQGLEYRFYILTKNMHRDQHFTVALAFLTVQFNTFWTGKLKIPLKSRSMTFFFKANQSAPQVKIKTI